MTKAIRRQKAGHSTNVNGIDCMFLSCHVRFETEFSLCSCFIVKELLARSRCEIWSLSDCNWTRIHNRLVEKNLRNLNDPKCMIKVCSDCSPWNIISSCNADSWSSTAKMVVNQIVMMKLMKFCFQCEFAQIKYMKKVTKYFPQEEFYNQWEKTLMELNEQIHIKRMQVYVNNVCKANLKQAETILQRKLQEQTARWDPKCAFWTIYINFIYCLCL